MMVRACARQLRAAAGAAAPVFVSTPCRPRGLIAMHIMDCHAYYTGASVSREALKFE